MQKQCAAVFLLHLQRELFDFGFFQNQYSPAASSAAARRIVRFHFISCTPFSVYHYVIYHSMKRWQ